ncbi:MAG: hypothetical protein IKN49_01605 [Elusimicrobiaceae bacterium]|nr:hypothetical protein [Elusimicrobiaceae bacterium]
MHKTGWVLLLIFLSGLAGLQAQSYPTSVDASNAVEAPPSSIDLLKRSAGASSVKAVAPVAATSQSSSGTSTDTTAAKPAPTKSTGSYLEMPLSSGTVVKTQVQPTIKPAPRPAKVTTPAPDPAPTAVEKDIEQNNALAEGEKTGVPVTSVATPADTPAEPTVSGETNSEAIAQEELDYAARMLRQAKQENSSGRFIPPPAAISAQEVPPTPTTTARRPYDPNEYRPGVEWIKSNSTNFVIYTQKREGGIGSSNMGMTFESAYATLRRNIPWMMSDKVRVFVYQDHNSYLKYEPNAKAWARALAYPTRGEIVVYDEPGKQQELKEVFTHELVHIFTQKFFDKYKTGKLMTPTWLDEGLAVYMEDQAYNGSKGGPWNHDLKTLNIQRSEQSQVNTFSSTAMFGSSSNMGSGPFRAKKGRPVYLMPFDQFMQEGSLSYMEGRGKTQDWYFQAYAMVRFLLNPAGGSSPSNRMQFEQFTRLIAQGEQVRDPKTGFPMRGPDGKPVYQPYSVEKAMGRSYHYNNASNFEDNFWRWVKKQ